MSELLKRQIKFSRMVGRLLIYAESIGYDLTHGDAYRDARCPYGHETSLHKERLAIDFNLFIDGQFQPSTDAHRPLGEFWETMGGTWGGRGGDGNHYSLGPWGGMKF